MNGMQVIYLIILSSRPTWYNTIENNLSLITSETGVIYTGNPEILKKFCPGIYGTIKPIGICMIGANEKYYYNNSSL